MAILDRLYHLKPEKVFLFFAILFGLALTFITPPVQAPDEASHLHRAYAVSHLNLFGSRDSQPRSINKVINTFYPLRQIIPAHLQVSQILSELNRSLAPEKTTPNGFKAATLYPPFIYLPQAVGIALARGLGLGPLLLFYFGRLFNLSTWILLGYLALRLTPSYRWLFLMILLIPMEVFLAGSLSPDVVTNAVSILMIAVVLRMASDCYQKIGWREVGLLAFLFALIGMTKAPYAVLTLVYFLIPRYKFKNIKQYWISTGVVFLVLVAAVLVSQVPSLIDQGGIRKTVTSELSPLEGLRVIIQHPFYFLKLSANTVVHFGYSYLFRSYIGSFGWMDTYLPEWQYPIALILLVLAGLLESSSVLRLKFLDRLLTLAICVGVMLTINVLFFVQYATLANRIIVGVQGRYFLPLGPLPYLFFSNAKYSQRFRVFLPPVLIAGISLLLVSTVWQLLVRFYL